LALEGKAVLYLLSGLDPDCCPVHKIGSTKGTRHYRDSPSVRVACRVVLPAEDIQVVEHAVRKKLDGEMAEGRHEWRGGRAPSIEEFTEAVRAVTGE
jgi:hypothetical protein